MRAALLLSCVVALIASPASVRADSSRAEQPSVISVGDQSFARAG